jgi:uncharacterized protein
MTLNTSTIIEGPAGKLEAIREDAAIEGPLSDQGYYAVVCHPHPLYGGTMDDGVVTTTAEIYRELGVPTARFNFRGVGASEGKHDNADGEVADLAAVAEWLQQQVSGTRLLIAGYSFGSVVAATASSCLSAEHLVLLAPPVEHYSFAPQGCFDCPVIVVLGEQDELVDLQYTKAWVEQLTSTAEAITIAGASHFFNGQLMIMRNQLRPVLLNALR